MNSNEKTSSPGIGFILIAVYHLGFAQIVALASDDYWNLSTLAESGMWVAGLIVSLMPWVRAAVLVTCLLMFVPWWASLLITAAVSWIQMALFMREKAKAGMNPWR